MVVIRPLRSFDICNYKPSHLIKVMFGSLFMQHNVVGF